MTDLIRLGDTSNHGGEVVTASQTMRYAGRCVAREGDLVKCPLHPKSSPISLSKATGELRIAVSPSRDRGIVSAAKERLSAAVPAETTSPALRYRMTYSLTHSIGFRSQPGSGNVPAHTISVPALLALHAPCSIDLPVLQHDGAGHLLVAKRSERPKLYFQDPEPDSAARHAVGTVLYFNQAQAVLATAVYIYCDVGTYSYSVNGARQVTSNRSTYDTGVQGIGIRFYRAQGASGLRSYYGPTDTGTYAGNWRFDNAYFGFKLVVTGSVGSGRINGSARGAFDQENWTVVDTFVFSDGPITQPSCSVTNSSIAVTLPSADAASLSAQGATTEATPFNIALNNCDQGTAVSVTLTDASNISNRSATLSLAPDSTAAGVGLQLLNGSTPIAYVPDSASAGNQNQRFAGTASGSSMTIPLTVQYVRTDKALTPGTVRGLATFTIAYE
jgi:type 1 fimbria pilin